MLPYELGIKCVKCPLPADQAPNTSLGWLLFDRAFARQLGNEL